MFIIIISQFTTFANTVRSVLTADRCKEITVLDSFDLIAHYYAKSIITPPNHTHNFPNEILAGRLYLGNEKQAQCRYAYENLGITHVVNCTRGIPNKFEDR
jgi:hypothetical protein